MTDNINEIEQVNETIENNENVETNLITISEIAEDYNNIQIKAYLPYVVKSKVIKNILNTVVSENEQGLIIINYPLLSLVKDIFIFYSYTNVNIFEENDDIDITYDKLKEMGAIDYVLSQIPHEEFYFFDEVIVYETQQLFRVENSVSNVLAKTINKLTEKIPSVKEINKLIPKISKELAKISPETLELLKSVNKNA